jgi:membrane carboxypeptidase/penicillin-binding protein PbpC
VAQAGPGEVVGQAGTLRLISPTPGARYRKLDDLTTEQRLPLKVEWRERAPLYWFVDNQLIATAPASEALSWPLVKGRHVVVVASASGEAVKAEIEVE